MENSGASVVITHHILNGKQQEYEKWLEEIKAKSHRPLTNGFYTGQAMPEDFE